MKFKYIVIGILGFSNMAMADISTLANHFQIRNTYFSVAGVAATLNSDNIRESYPNLPGNEFIPALNSAQINGGTGGLQLESGFQSKFHFLNLKTGLQYLYLAEHNQQAAPFYNTGFFDSAFMHQVTVNALNATLGVSYDLSSQFNIYVDGGVGVVFLNSYASYATNSDGSDLININQNYTQNFTWRLGGGGVYRLSPHWGIDLGLHYADFGTVDYGHFATTPALVNGVNINAPHFNALLLTLGLDYL